MSENKFIHHFGWLFDLVPEINTVEGFFFYSFFVYLAVVFFGWLANPTMDKLLEEKQKSDANLHKT